MKQSLLFILFFLVSTFTASAQNVVYTVGGNQIQGAILVSASQDKVSFSVPNGSVYIFQRSNIAVAFSDKGNFLVISELSPDSVAAQQQISDYKTPPQWSLSQDYIIKAVPLEVILGQITYKSDAVVNYKKLSGESASIPTGELVGILHRDGRHELVINALDAAPILIDVKKQLLNPPPTTQQVKSAITQPAVSEPSRPATVQYIPTTTGSDPAPLPTDKSRTLVLSEADYQDYRKKALQRVDEFVSYLNIITDKSQSLSVKNNAIDQAARLFMPAATMEVTSKSRPGSRKYPIREYLNRLKLLPYNSAKIDWTEIQYLKELSQAADGNYYGIITGQQTFFGYGNTGNVMYSDVTSKRVRVKLERYNVIDNGNEIVKWNLLLGNIGVGVN